MKQKTSRHLVAGPGLRNNVSFVQQMLAAQPSLLSWLDVVSGHFYQAPQATPPENRVAFFNQLKQAIQPYIPSGRNVPVICSEWGVATLGNGAVSERTQGAYDVRAFLTSMALQLPVDIRYAYYSTSNSGVSDGFGIVANPATFQVKPAYNAIGTMNYLLTNNFFSGALSGYGNGDYVYKFYNPGTNSSKIAAWTTSSNHYVRIPVQGSGQYFDFVGNAYNYDSGGNGYINLYLNDTPQYVVLPAGQ